MAFTIEQSISFRMGKFSAFNLVSVPTKNDFLVHLRSLDNGAASLTINALLIIKAYEHKKGKCGSTDGADHFLLNGEIFSLYNFALHLRRLWPVYGAASLTINATLFKIMSYFVTKGATERKVVFWARELD